MEAAFIVIDVCAFIYLVIGIVVAVYVTHKLYSIDGRPDRLPYWFGINPSRLWGLNAPMYSIVVCVSFVVSVYVWPYILNKCDELYG